MTMQLEGESVLPSQLRSQRAIAVQHYLSASTAKYFQLVDCRANDQFDILCVRVGVEVSQQRPVDIKSTEEIAIFFSSVADSLPIFLPLRSDFPTDLVHVMVDCDHAIPSLCLWDSSFEELRSRLTPFGLLARLKEWLEQAAAGTLHHSDQPLEPVFIGCSHQVILPIEAGRSDERYVAFSSPDLPDHYTLHFLPQSQLHQCESHEFPGHVLAAFTTPVIDHRAVRFMPRNLQQLHGLLLDIGFDLREALKQWVMQTQQKTDLMAAIPVILFTFPKRRISEGEVESYEECAFSANSTFGKLGEALGAFADTSQLEGIDSPATLLGEPPEASSLRDFTLIPLFVRRELSSHLLPKLSGYLQHPPISIAAVGVGALGSKVIELAVRCGYGQWTLIDKDVFLPHNSVRHVLGSWAVGSSKAERVKEFVNSLVPGMPISNAIVSDIMNPQVNVETLNQALSGADLILDMSASVVAARKLCEHPDSKRCASLFLNPSGTDIVLLLENADRTTTLWDLEGAYYQALISNNALNDHLTQGGSTSRYGNGCRDLTAQISADQASVLAGVATRQLINKSASPESSAIIWRMDLDCGNVKAFPLLIKPSSELSLGPWRVRWSHQLLVSLMTQRHEDLPNETGGVLLGVVDLEHRVIVISASVSAPLDSLKRPDCFERGASGLFETLSEIDRQTLGQVRYLGEWHSHPDQSGVFPSKQDEGLFETLGGVFANQSEPYVMAILGLDRLFTRLGFNEKFYEEELLLSILGE